MDEKTRFRTALAALSAGAVNKDRKLTQEEMQDFFKEMNLTKEQQDPVYAYLASQGIRVEGREKTVSDAEKKPLTMEEQAFLDQYKRDMRHIKKQQEDQMETLFSRAADGDAQAKRYLTEHYMDKVLPIARAYTHQGLLLQDLVQVGNVGLMVGIDTLGLMEEGMVREEHLEREIHRAIRAALDEHEDSKSTGSQVVEKLNRLADAITELTEDLGRHITPEELSLYVDIPLEEIEALLQIAGDNIEMADEENMRWK